MYTDEDLNNAVGQGIFSEDSVTKFREFISRANRSPAVDEENFRLVTSFNDIFVVIACILLLASSAWVTYSVDPSFAMWLVAALSWGLAEFFVLKRNMALPAILLLLVFVSSVFAFFVLVFATHSEKSYMIAAAAASLAVWLHWRRFRVPVTAAAGAITGVIFVIATMVAIFPGLRNYVNLLMFTGGIVIFMAAMYWDSTDINRITRRSDISFWLHLVSAPLIVHPVFSNMGNLAGENAITRIFLIVLLYLVLTLISLIIDRRAFMVSSLMYVLFALTNLFKTFGLAGNNVAFVGVVLGFSLLLLSGFWHKARRQLVRPLPDYIKARVPTIR